ncbi:pickpocket 13 [Ptiloglossa arizonensis]|uniref:pickpocket 13 n=1 Tax=Ptiloglossa arizonensis TaxID=3350558 RepID=UPI003FA064B7
MWKRLIRWWQIIKQLLRNCSIHGVRYLVDDQLSYPERFFWLFFCGLSWYGCGDMIKKVLVNYYEYPVAVTTETMYADWVTPFPAIAFCISSSKTIKSKYFKRNPAMFINFSTPDFIYATTEDLLSAYEETRLSCTELLVDCEWNNVKFNCCAEFQELKKTGVGYCLAMNTFHLNNNEPSVRFFVNRTVKYGDMIIDINLVTKKAKSLATVLMATVFNNFELPMVSNIEMDEIRLKTGKTTRVEFTMHDTFNEDGVKNVAIRHRNCRFPNENHENSLFDIYSSDSCYLEVIIERMIKFCGCVHFYYFIPRGARACNGSETLCIIANKTSIVSQSAKDEQCLPNCEGTSLSIHRWEPYEYNSPGRSYTRIHIALLSHPAVRYRRYVTNDFLDVVVSVGSAVGLFMGVSILSIFEIPYWLFIRRDEITSD